MIEATQETLEKDNYLLYIYTPFCGTCQFAKTILKDIENNLSKELFYELNASFYPEFMQREKIESVPCLLIKEAGKIEKKIYTFYSVPFMVREIMSHPNLVV